MKRLLVLLGITCMLVFCLSGCSGTAPESETAAPAAEEAVEPAAPQSEDAGSLADQASEAAQEATDAARDAAEEATK